MVQKCFRNSGRKRFTVHGKRVACRHSGLVGPPHNQGIETPHFLFQQADGVGKFVSPETVGAYKLGELICVMRRRSVPGPHFIQCDLNSPLRQLPCGFGSRKSGADDTGADRWPMKIKIGILPRLFIAIALGAAIGLVSPDWVMRSLNCFRDTPPYSCRIPDICLIQACPS